MKRLILLVLIFYTAALISSCRKQPVNEISFSGKILDAHTLQPVPNYHIRLNLIDGSAGMGLNLGSHLNIANAFTNANGEYNLKIDGSYFIDSTYYYVIDSYSNDNYFGSRKELNAKKAEQSKTNTIDTIKVYKRMVATFFIRQLGVLNATNFIYINITGVLSFASDLFYGSDSLKQNTYGVVPDLPTVITWRGKKNNIPFGPITDTVVFTNSNNTYSISY